MKSFEELISVIQTLRGENGCAWDRVQTFDSLIPCFLEEAYEVIEAINNRDYENIKEELGDVLLHVVFFSELAKDENKFDINDVCLNINKKLIRRHPHVFGDSDVKDVQGILKQWDKIKKEEKENNNINEFKSILDEIPKSLPIMEKSYKLMKKAASVGFEYKNIDDSLSKIDEELLEVKEAYKEKDKEHLEEEIGDLIMTVLDFARMNKINPVNSLIKVNNKFKKRFNYIEETAAEMNKKLECMTLEEMDNLWNEYKKKEREDK
ncbi:nucleoside triphosphate pyrophosphohydrolase [uncultured Brachyspira sp.]|uniref:nucleoside triphosphate pyrophosphohydrolase n=1 Tax=uncultured Brachyspira sp. TaxID=221953 RepID=UPI0025FFF9B5|nr:nucleoside triphosphate pyrophosphohydrolase [uncultured Brachyspira sp.]